MTTTSYMQRSLQECHHARTPIRYCKWTLRIAPVLVVVAASLIAAMVTVSVHLNVPIAVHLLVATRRSAVAVSDQVAAAPRLAPTAAHPEGGVSRLPVLHPAPALLAPVAGRLVAAITHELQKFAVRDGIATRLERSDPARQRTNAFRHLLLIVKHVM